MKKKLSAILALLLCGTCLPVMPLDANAETEKADISQDGIVCVVKAFHSTESTVYLLDNGCAIGPGTFNYLGQDYESQFGENFELQYGDVFYICCEGINFTSPPEFDFGKNGKIYYLGNAKDYCKDRMVELTLTENSPRNLFHWWSDDEGVRHCDEQCDYSEEGYVNYIDYSQFEVGDKALCALDEDGDVLAVYPIENQESDIASMSVVAGDVDESGEVGIVDVLAVNQALLSVRSLSAYGELAGDVNHNGTLDDGDAVKILKSLVDLETLD